MLATTVVVTLACLLDRSDARASFAIVLRWKLALTAFGKQNFAFMLSAPDLMPLILEEPSEPALRLLSHQWFLLCKQNRLEVFFSSCKNKDMK